MTPAQRIRRRRRELGLTEKQVAYQVGVSERCVSKWERDETDPRAKHIIALCCALRCSADWLLGIESTHAGTAGDTN